MNQLTLGAMVLRPSGFRRRDGQCKGKRKDAYFELAGVWKKLRGYEAIYPEFVVLHV